MSAVTLLCADRPLPLYESGVRRVETSSYGGYTVRIEASGFSVGEHTYYREAVEDLYLTMKPCRYQLDLRATQEDAAELRPIWQSICAPERPWNCGTCGWGTTPRDRGAFPAPWGMWSWTP